MHNYQCILLRRKNSGWHSTGLREYKTTYSILVANKHKTEKCPDVIKPESINVSCYLIQCTLRSLHPTFHPQDTLNKIQVFILEYSAKPQSFFVS